MKRPHIGQQVMTSRGPGSIEKVYYGTITMLNPRRRFVMCTVALDQPFQDKYKNMVKRIESEVMLHRSRVYERC